MTLSWKKWVCFLILAILAFAACQYYAERHLAELLYRPPALVSAHVRKTFDEMMSGISREKERYEFFKNIVTWADDNTHMPWPIPAFMQVGSFRRFDPDHPATRDPETIMGLALLGPIPDTVEVPKRDRWNVWDEEAWKKYFREKRAWFRRLSKLAISLAEDKETKRRLEQLTLYVESAADRSRDREQEAMAEVLSAAMPPHTRRPTTSMADLKKRFTHYIQKRAKVIDPTNALYAYMDAEVEIHAITGRIEEPKHEDTTLPSEESAQYYELIAPSRLVATAKKIDEILSEAERRCTLKGYRARSLDLMKKGRAFRKGRKWGSLLGFMPLPPGRMEHNARFRDLIRRLSFVGDQLSARGEDQLALNMYRHGYKLAEALILAENKETDFIQFLTANACMAVVNGSIMEFWAGKGNVQKVAKSATFASYSRGLSARVSRNYGQRRVDPIGHSDSSYVTYARWAALPWWLGVTGIVFAVLSLASAVIYLVLGRGRFPGEAPLRISYKMFGLGIGVPVIVMVCLLMAIPLGLDDPLTAGSLTAWAYVSCVVWVIAVGLMARHVGSSCEDVERSPTGWVWPLTAVGIASVCIGASLFVEDLTQVVSAGLGVLVMSSGILLWSFIVVLTWLAHRGEPDTSYRARTNKAFAVCGMMAAVVFLLVALASMPGTYYQQDRYYKLADAQMREEMTYYLAEDRPKAFDPGEGWPKAFKRLGFDMFTLKSAAPQNTP